MRRREFVKRALAASGALTSKTVYLHGLVPDQRPASPEVERVLVMFKCHLDVGFTDTQARVMRKYFDQYYPQALQVAAAMRQLGEDRYVWTTGSWLLYEYLEQATHEQHKRMDQAVADGDVAWHALPFTWETEMLDRSMITGALGLSQSLDRRYGRTTTGAKMTDVPGHSRGLIGPLAANGVKLLDIGVNSASTPPEVPPLFVWKDPAGDSLMVMYHHKEYGGVVQVPGSNLAVSIQVRNDNDGPHSVDEVKRIYAQLRGQFPHAKVTASNLTEIANALEPFRSRLPAVTQEIGDTWIYGVPSDPVKVARYREICRLRGEWIAQGDFRAADPTDLALLRRLLLAAEHTWGVDNKRLGDYDHYTSHDLARVLDKPAFKVAIASWAEKRNNIDDAISSLPDSLRSQANQRIRGLRPTEPERAGLEAHQAGSEIDATHFVLALDAKTGTISRLRSKKTGREWASPEHPLALFSYQTLSKEDYDRFLASYVVLKTWWSPQDFGKPNIEHFGAQSRVWLPTVADCWSGNVAEGHRILSQLHIDDAASADAGIVAWPRKVYLDLLLPDREPVVRIIVLWFDKPATRLPEAMWLSFLPQTTEPQGWVLEKMDQQVSPFDVVRGGNRHMHTLSGAIRYQDAQGGLAVETLDAPVVALGEKSPIYYSGEQPEMARGIHFSLFNNAWGTNYIQWFGEDMRFRFVLRA